MKSLRSTGSAVAALAATRSSRDPPNQFGSVRTDSADAPVRGDDVLDARAVADRALRRRAALVLGDDRDARPGQRLGERPWLRARPEHRLELLERVLAAA